VGERLGIEPARHEERAFEDGEHKIRPLESVRGRDAFVVQSFASDADLSVNDKLVRVLTLVGALRDAGAQQITVVAPYLCYARKDVRTKPRDPVTTRYIAALFEAAGTTRVVTVDVHNPAAYENAFRIPAELLTARPVFVEAFVSIIGDRPVSVVSPDAGGLKRAERFREALERRLGREVPLGYLGKFRSEGLVRGGELAGDVEGRAAILIDDLISSGTTLARAAHVCRERGAPVVYAAATHGVFSEKADRVLTDSNLERIVLLDTLPPQNVGPELSRRLQVLDCAPLLASAIDRLHRGESLMEFIDA
jgi:ribose-phosphate pyrophosphokinase